MASATGTFNYINPIAAPPSPKECLKIGFGVGTPDLVDELLVGKQKKVRNGRESRFLLQEDGFEMLSNIKRPFQHPSELDNLRARYYKARSLCLPLAVDMAKKRFGADPFYAHFLPPYYRKAPLSTSKGKVGSSVVDTREHSSGSTPHAVVHSDFGFGYKEQMLHDADPDTFLNYRDPQKARALHSKFERAGRMVILQFWMSAQTDGTVIENDFLALCHPRSIQTTDLVSRNLPVYNGYKINYSVLHAKDSPSHEWFYWPFMKTNECLVWVGYDSAWGDQMTPCFHSSFRDENTFPDKHRPRESLECRVMLLFDEKVRSRL